jgi:hypothetical protein
MAILDLISHVHLPSFVNMLPKYLKHSTFSSCFWSINDTIKEKYFSECSIVHPIDGSTNLWQYLSETAGTFRLSLRIHGRDAISVSPLHRDAKCVVLQPEMFDPVLSV